MFLFLNSWYTSVEDFYLQKEKGRHCLQPTVSEPPQSNTGLTEVAGSLLPAYVRLWTIGRKEPGCGGSWPLDCVELWVCGCFVACS